MKNYKTLTISQLTLEKKEVEHKRTLAYRLSEDDSTKNYYLNLCELQLSEIQREINRRAVKKSFTHWLIDIIKIIIL